jgi:hypothetical protein
MNPEEAYHDNGFHEHNKRAGTAYISGLKIGLDTGRNRTLATSGVTGLCLLNLEARRGGHRGVSGRSDPPIRIDDPELKSLLEATRRTSAGGATELRAVMVEFRPDSDLARSGNKDGRVETPAS